MSKGKYRLLFNDGYSEVVSAWSEEEAEEMAQDLIMGADYDEGFWPSLVKVECLEEPKKEIVCSGCNHVMTIVTTSEMRCLNNQCDDKEVLTALGRFKQHPKQKNGGLYGDA